METGKKKTLLTMTRTI